MECSRRSFVHATMLGCTGAVLGSVAQVALGDEAAAPEDVEPVSEGASAPFVPGTYIGTATGNSGTVVVETVMEDGPAIASVRVVDHDDTDHMMHEVAAILPGRVVDAQSVLVDAVAGATLSSRAVLDAVADCITQSGADLNVFEAEPQAAQSEDTVSCQVLVVGSGAGGLVASLVLKNRGIDVLLVDTQDFTGGTARFSQGVMLATFDAEAVDEVRDEFMRQTTLCELPYDTEKFPNMDKVDQYAESGHDMVVFLRDVLNLPLQENEEGHTVTMGDSSYGDISIVKGYQLTQALTDAYVQAGGRLLLGTKVEELVLDGNGAVVGARAHTSSGTLTIEAPYVIVACGGPSGDLLERYYPARADGEVRCIAAGCDGTGVQMMIDAGAKVLPDWICSAGTASTHPELARTKAIDVFSAPLINGIAGSDTLLVDRNGERLSDESNKYSSLMFYKAGEIDCEYVILDRTLAERRGVLITLEEGLVSEPENFFKAATIEDLAEACGFNPSVFAETVDTYNGYCATGVDEAHGKPADYLVALENPPFYAVYERFATSDVAGGVYTDINRNVVNDQDEPIQGLFSIGLASARDTYGNGAPGGGSVGLSAATGYVAASYIADQLAM